MDMSAEQQFEISFGGETAQVSEHMLPSGRIFRIVFPQPKIKPLVIAVAVDKLSNKYWVSIPDGRGEEAAAVGKLIADHIRSKR